MKILSMSANIGRQARLCACAYAVFVAAGGLPAAQAATDNGLTLQHAIALAADTHPQLKSFQYRDLALEYSGQSAALQPGYRLAFELENVAGTGEAKGLSAAEATLSLSSAFESPAKRRARLAMVDARRAELEVAQRIAALQVATEVTERFMQVVIYREQLRVARDEKQLASELVTTVSKRVSAGAAPRAELRRARASRATARLKVTRLQSLLAASKSQLAMLWGETGESIGSIDAKLFGDLQPGDFESLQAALNASPTLLLLTAQERVAKSTEREVTSQNSADIEWSIGARRLQGSQDVALVAGVAIPLNAGSRNSAAINTAMANRQILAVERDAALLKLRLRLKSEYQRRVVALETLSVLRREVIPELRRALKETRDAYLRGRYSYLELIAVRTELLSAREAAVDAAAEAQLARLQLEALTGEPLLAVASLDVLEGGQ